MQCKACKKKSLPSVSSTESHDEMTYRCDAFAKENLFRDIEEAFNVVKGNKSLTEKSFLKYYVLRTT